MGNNLGKNTGRKIFYLMWINNIFSFIYNWGIIEPGIENKIPATLDWIVW